MSKKTIWITGGSTGIGKALAIKFASKGWNVAISARRAELLNELSNSYENISSFPLDVTDKEKCKEVFNEIKNKYESIDICFFSTGTWDPKKENKIDEHNYEGTAGDVVGKAIGYSYGPAFKFEYVLLVPVKGKELKITFDDWIFKQDDRVAINRATMTKFGFKVAELTVVFVKD